MTLKQNTEVGTSCRRKYVMNTVLKLSRSRALLLAASVVFILFFFCGPACAGLAVDYISSIAISGGSPIRLASDAEGIIYVAVPAAGKVFKFFQDGSPAGVITASQKPLSVAVDSTGKVFVGDYMDGSVRVVGSDGQVLYSLGQGKGEFRTPGGIAVSSNGLAYVTDSSNNVVKVYNPDGTFRFLFGGYGTAPGQMIFPSGICSDDANNEIYVVDQTNGRVEVFSPDGVFRRSFGSYGSGQGMLTRGQGIHVANGKVYVADAYLSTVEVFDTAGSFVSFIGGYGSGPGGLKMPMDVMMIGTTLYVTNSDNARIEIFDVVDPQGLAVSPSDLSFAGYAGANALPQTVLIDPEIEGAQVAWTVTVSAPFGLTVSAAGGVAPAQVEVGIDVAGLPAGTYTGAVVFHANGNDYPVTVQLTISEPPARLLVSPAALSVSNLNGTSWAQSISVGASRGSLPWTASTDVSWLMLSPASGNTPVGLITSLNQNVKSLAPGTYAGTVTITAPGAEGSPVVIPVTLTVQQELSISPANLFLSCRNGVFNSQTISVSTDVGTLAWSAVADVSWLTLSSASGATPASLTASVNNLANTLSDGVYNGSITITAPAAGRSPAVIPVSLTVVRQTVLVSPNSIDMFHQIAGDLMTKAVVVENSGGALNWSATTNVQWLKLKPSSGGTPAIVTISLNSNVDSLSEGDYTASVTVNAPNAANSPVTVPVTVKVVKAGSLIVASNLEGTSFTLRGSTTSGVTVTLSGHGMNWRTDELEPGTYTIHFDHIQGYRRPADRAFDIRTGETVTLDVLYMALPVANVIAAGKGPDPKNDATIRVFDLNAGLLSEFLAMNTRYGARVAMADIDGDGVDEIIVSPGNGPLNQACVRVFRYDGSLVTETSPLARTLFGGIVAAGDIDGDGRAEVAMSIVDWSGSQTVIVYAFEGSALVERTRISLKKTAFYPAAIAFGDIDGDGWLELICVSSGKITVYAFDADLSTSYTLSSAAAPTLRDSWNDRVTVAAGDIDGDGSDEVLIGYGNGRDSMVQVLRMLNSELVPAGPPLKVFERGISSPSMSSMDIDGDGLAEILAGQSARAANNAALKVYDSRGRQIGGIRAFDSKYGVNAAFGVIGGVEGTEGVYHAK